MLSSRKAASCCSKISTAPTTMISSRATAMGFDYRIRSRQILPVRIRRKPFLMQKQDPTAPSSTSHSSSSTYSIPRNEEFSWHKADQHSADGIRPEYTHL